MPGHKTTVPQSNAGGCVTKGYTMGLFFKRIFSRHCEFAAGGRSNLISSFAAVIFLYLNGLFLPASAEENQIINILETVNFTANTTQNPGITSAAVSGAKTLQSLAAPVVK